MSKNTVKVKKYFDIVEEYPAAAALLPGHLIELTSAEKVQKHANAGQNVFPMFALEDELQGKGITDAFVADDRVQCWIPTRGDIVQAILKDGENVVAGDMLESAGDGTLQKHVAGSAGVVEYPLAIVGVVVEAVDLSGSSAVDPAAYVLVRIV